MGMFFRVLKAVKPCNTCIDYNILEEEVNSIINTDPSRYSSPRHSVVDNKSNTSSPKRRRKYSMLTDELKKNNKFISSTKLMEIAEEK